MKSIAKLLIAAGLYGIIKIYNKKVNQNFTNMEENL